MGTDRPPDQVALSSAGQKLPSRRTQIPTPRMKGCRHGRGQISLHGRLTLASPLPALLPDSLTNKTQPQSWGWDR